MIDDLVFNLRTNDYFIQRPHHNIFNKFFYSNLWKNIFPFHEKRNFTILDRQRSAEWYGYAPQQTWVDGVIDYTYNKHNINSIGHFHMHENRKNKPNKARVNGGDKAHNLFLTPTFIPSYYPKGCNREINKYKECKTKNSIKECVGLKINIVEICPKWVLEKLRESKKFMMKSTIIDNNIYRKAMNIETYNSERTLKDIKDKNSHLKKIRRDSFWSDDRYNPTYYSSADHSSNSNLGDISYNDILGGNIIENIEKERNSYLEKL